MQLICTRMETLLHPDGVHGLAGMTGRPSLNADWRPFKYGVRTMSVAGHGEGLTQCDVSDRPSEADIHAMSTRPVRHGMLMPSPARKAEPVRLRTSIAWRSSRMASSASRCVVRFLNS